MKKAVRNYFLYLGLVLSFLSASAATASAQGPLGQILNRMDAHNKALKSVQADVTMLKFNPQLNITDTYKGSTSYLPNAKGKRYMRLDWASPRVEQISVIGDDYKLLKPNQKQAYVGNVKKAKTSASAGNALGFMNMNKEQLKANYNVVYLGEENSTWRLQLTPKAQANYKSAELWIDGNGMPIQAKVFEVNGDTTTVILSNVRKNIVIDAKIFELDIRGATVLKT